MAVKGPYHHVHLLSPDPAAAAQWYVQNLGGQIVEEAELRGAMNVRLRLGEALLNIRGARPGENPSAGGGKTFGIDHLALSADEFDQTVANLEKSGTQFVEPVFTTPAGGRACFIEGPDRTLIEIMEG